MSWIHTCPQCSGTTVYRSRSWLSDVVPWALKIAGVFGFRKRRYRCADCRTRFWDLPARPPARQSHPRSSSYAVDRELENPAPRM